MPDHGYSEVEIAEELNDCRQRGLDWLDHATTNQRPVRTAVLEQLASDYAAARGMSPTGRVDQIKTLLRDGITEFERHGYTSDSALLRDLFFGDSMDGRIDPPGVLLRRAQARYGDSTESRFRARRMNVMRSFGQFLIAFSGPSTSGSEGRSNQSQQSITTGYVGNSARFIEHLANAVKVTIVGITNEHLTQMLEEALRRKREADLPDAFWESLRIVFLGKGLLGAVNDEREALEEPGRALRQRLQDAVWARRSVWDLLKRASPTRWQMWESSYLPVLNGALLQFKDNRKIAHLLIRRRRRPIAEHVYVELEDIGDRFGAVFEDIIHDSQSADMIVPVGYPANDTFHFQKPRNQREVLQDGSRLDGWLPMVLVITSRRVGGHAEPTLQLRTAANAERELGRISHLAGHVLEDDRHRPDGRILTAAPTSFARTDEAAHSAAQRVLQEVTSDDLSSELRPVETSQYLYPDKEHLLFFVFVLDPPSGIQFLRRAEMHTFPLPELMAIREGQILRSAVDLCRAADVPARNWKAAAQILALNLSLHDRSDLGQQLLDLAAHGVTERERTAVAIERHLVARTSPSLAEPGRDVQVTGLAGWQHREFFSVLLKLYAEVGINGAGELLAQVERDQTKRTARDRLAELYGDEDSMALVPFEL